MKTFHDYLPLAIWTAFSLLVCGSILSVLILAPTPKAAAQDRIVLTNTIAVDPPPPLPVNAQAAVCGNMLVPTTSRLAAINDIASAGCSNISAVYIDHDQWLVYGIRIDTKP